jgi:hypothetical protein
VQPRDLLIRQRSSLISAIRAHFAEFGIVVGQGIRNVERLLALLETAGEQRLPALAAEMLGILATTEVANVRTRKCESCQILARRIAEPSATRCPCAASRSEKSCRVRSKAQNWRLSSAMPRSAIPTRPARPRWGAMPCQSWTNRLRVYGIKKLRIADGSIHAAHCYR